MWSHGGKYPEPQSPTTIKRRHVFQALMGVVTSLLLMVLYTLLQLLGARTLGIGAGTFLAIYVVYWCCLWEKPRVHAGTDPMLDLILSGCDRLGMHYRPSFVFAHAKVPPPPRFS